MKYLISYDLSLPRREYELLYDTLEEMGAKRVLQSQWCVRKSNTTAKKLRAHFKKVIDSNDRLLIVPISGTGWAGRRLINDINSL